LAAVSEISLSAKAGERQDGEHDYNEAHHIDDAVHDFLRLVKATNERLTIEKVRLLRSGTERCHSMHCEWNLL
jgi:hypothetical protein